MYGSLLVLTKCRPQLTSASNLTSSIWMGSAAALDIHAKKCFSALYVEPGTFDWPSLCFRFILLWSLLHIPRSDGIDKI